MGPNGSENFKTPPLLQIAAKSFETCPEFSSLCSQKYVGHFWNFEFPIFSDFFENFKFTIVAYGEIKYVSYLEKNARRAERIEIWDSGVVPLFNIYGLYSLAL